jgi:hypothetical protein
MVLTLALVIFVSPASFSQQYVINAYQGDSIPMPVKTVFVDLDTKTILCEIVIADEGQLLNKKALPIALNADTLLISAVIAGCYCENSTVSMQHTILSVFDPISRTLVFSRSDSNLFLNTFEKLPNHRIFISGQTFTQPRRFVRGDYALGTAFNLVLRNQRSEDYAYNLYDGLGSFPQLRGLATQRNLYKGNHGTAWFIVKTNDNREIIVDSLVLNNTPYRSHIMAVIDSLLYDFNLNWEMHTEYTQKDFGQNSIDSHLRLYRLSDFAPLDSIPVADYPPGDYPDGTFDVADVVGPYIVYYFFGREGIMRYAPAMLFIFDTRTNEATWLRVGWR